MSIWKIVGIILLTWALYDIKRGFTYLHRSISRRDEPTFFWAVAASWVAIAVVMIISY